MKYVLSKNLELYSPGGICHLCRDKREELQHSSCNSALKCGGYCEECQLDMQSLETFKCEKASVYNLLRTGMVNGPVEVFTRYHKKNIRRTRTHVYEGKSKLTEGVIGYDANASCLYCYVMPSGKDTLVVNKKPFDQNKLQNFQRTF